MGTRLVAACERLEGRVLLSASSYVWQNADIGGGGFVDGIVFSPTQPNVVYARTDIGGLYKSTNDGTTWQELLDFVGTNASTSGNGTNSQMMGVLSVAIDPENANNIYLDTGQYTGQDGWVLSSTNGGQSFSITSLPFYVGGNSNGRGTGERLAVDPNDGSILFLGSNNDGLWESTNSAGSFQQVASFPSAAGTDGITFVTFGSGGTPGSPTQTIFVGVDATAAGSNVYETTNGGTSWSEMSGGPTGLIPMQGELASDGSMYFTFANGLPPNGTLTTGSVWRYSSSGIWSNITPVIPGVTNGTSDTFGYDGLAVDPENPDTVVVTSFDRYNFGDQIWRTTDANSASPTWTALFDFQGYGGNNTTRNTSTAPWIAAFDDGIGNWAAGVAINPDNSAQIFYGNGQGLWATNQGTSTVTLTAANSWYFPDTGIEFTAVGKVAAAPTGTPLFSAMGDIGGFAHTTLTSSPAAGATLSGTSETSVDFAQDNPNDVVLVGTTSGTYGAYSTNDGATFTKFAGNPGSSDNGGTVAISANGSTIEWAPSGQSVYYSTNDGTTWTAASVPSGTGKGGEVISDRVTADLFYYYAGTRLYESTNSGATFTLVNSNVSSGGNLTANPNVAGDLWLASSAGLYHSTNSGASFARVAASTVTSANLVALGMAAPGESYPAVYIFGTIGGFLGLYRSDDEGATWTQINNTSEQFGGLIQTLAADPNVFGRVYLGVNGRGVIYGQPATSVPSGWTDADIGTPGNPGLATSATTLSNGTTVNQWTVVGGGAGLSGSSDQFNFASESLNGNGTITADLNSLTNNAPAAKAGIMIGESANANSAFAAILDNPGGTLTFEWRATDGGTIQSTSVSGNSAPLYLELTRQGSSFLAYASTNGISYTQIGATETVTMNPGALAGLAVTAGNNANASSAVFTGVTVGPTTINWTGLGDGVSWNNPANWSNNAAPNQYDSVVIPAGVAALTIGAGTFSVSALNSASPILINGGLLQLLGNSVIDGSVTIQNGGDLDVESASLIINYAGGSDPISAIQSYLASGYNGGAWNGSGIISSSVAAENAGQSALIYGVGYADGADGIVAGLPSGQIEIMPTLAGDAKLQGNVVFGDFQLLSQYFGQSGGWDEGNFTYGSEVNFGDFQLLSQNFGQATSLTEVANSGADAPAAVSVRSAAAASIAAAPPIGQPSTEGDAADEILDGPAFSDLQLLGRFAV
jgi:hypothetical protein